jgi:hypothetical protein
MLQPIGEEIAHGCGHGRLGVGRHFIAGEHVEGFGIGVSRLPDIQFIGEVGEIYPAVNDVSAVAFDAALLDKTYGLLRVGGLSDGWMKTDKSCDKERRK